MKKTKTTLPTFPPYLTEDERLKEDDYEWALHDMETRRKYGGKVVVVYRKRILGAGKNHRAAWAAAQRRRDCPQRYEVAMPVVPHLIPAS
jgi:hypothetical protein